LARQAIMSFNLRGLINICSNMLFFD